MNRRHGLSSGEPTLTAVSRNALDHPLLAVLFLGSFPAIAWDSFRTIRQRRAARADRVEVPATPWLYPEPPARRLLRICIGVLKIVDRLLQTQSAMPLGLTLGE
jgi:hypothetical protein